MDLSSTQGPTRSDSAPTAHTLESPRLPTYTTPSPTVAELGPTVRFVPFRSSSAVANPSTLDTRPSTPSTTSTLPVLPAGTHTRWWTRSYARKSMATPPAGAPGSAIEWTVRTDGAVADVSVGPARQPVARIARSSTAFRKIIGPSRGCRVTLRGARVEPREQMGKRQEASPPVPKCPNRPIESVAIQDRSRYPRLVRALLCARWTCLGLARSPRPQVNRTTRSFVTGVCGSSPAIGRGVHAPRDAPTDGDPVYAPTGPERRPARGTLAPRVRGLARVAFLFICSRPSLAACAGSMASDSPWELSVGGQVGVPRGYVQVRENQIRGTRLQLHRDLGIDTSESLTLGAAYHLTALDALRLTFDSVLLYGSSRLPTKVEFNGTTLRGRHGYRHSPRVFSASRRSMSDVYSPSAVAAISRGTSASRMSFSPSNSTAPSLRARRTPTWPRTSSPRSYRFLSWDSGSTGRSSIGSASSAR